MTVDRRLKVLHVIDSMASSRGGTTAAVIGLAEGTAEETHTIVATDVGGPHPADTHSAKLLLFPPTRPTVFGSSYALGRWLDAEVASFDLVEIHSIFHMNALVAAATCWRRKVPYIVRPHGSLDPYDLRKHAAAKSIVGPTAVKWLLNQAASIVLTAEREADDLKSYGSKTARKVIPLPVMEMLADGGERARAREHLGLTPEVAVFLFLGRLHPKKGLERLLLAVHNLRRETLHLLIAGGGDPVYEAHLQYMARAMDVEHLITWCGPVADRAKREVLTAADAFVLHSDNENFGISVVEAAQAGLALVLSADVYIARTFAEAGAAVTPTAEGLAKAMETLVRDPLLLDSMQRRAREGAVNHFSPQVALRRQAEFRRYLIG